MRRSRSFVPLLLRQYASRPLSLLQAGNGLLSNQQQYHYGWNHRSSLQLHLTFSSQASAASLADTAATTSTATTTTTPTTSPPPLPLRRVHHVVVPSPRTDVPHKQKATDVLPTRHSRNMLAPTCLDADELQQLTLRLLRSSPGSLYPYVEPQLEEDEDDEEEDEQEEDEEDEEFSSTTSITRFEQDAAWKEADLTIQQAEYVIRGHATRIPGTMWHRWWLVEGDDDNNDYFETSLEEQLQNNRQQARTSLEQIIAIVDRLQFEGVMYMKLRQERLAQLALERGENDEDEEEEEDHDKTKQMVKKINLTTDTDSDDDDEDDHDNEEEKKKEDERRKELALLHPFAAPGPTVAMLDTLLDCFAVAAPICPDLVTPEATAEVLTMILDRHMIDGSDEKNTNPFTVPTLLSYNAFLRTMANMPYDDDANKLMRDQALYYSFGIYDTLRHSNNLARNSATMTYLLCTVAKFFPPSRTRGNVAHGLWMHAVRQGLIDPNVMEALRAAHTPTNGPEFEAWKKVYLDDKQVRDLPQKLYKFAKVKRHVPRDATY